MDAGRREHGSRTACICNVGCLDAYNTTFSFHGSPTECPPAQLRTVDRRLGRPLRGDIRHRKSIRLHLLLPRFTSLACARALGPLFSWLGVAPSGLSLARSPALLILRHLPPHRRPSLLPH
jgi:hypothetical protein